MIDLFFLFFFFQSFSDLCGAVMIGAGMLGAVIAGLIVDKYKNFEEVAKVGFAFATLSFIVFAVVSMFNLLVDECS